MQSSPDLLRVVGAGAAGQEASTGDGGTGLEGVDKAGRGGTMPPPLPDRPGGGAFARADLHAIRESNASSLR